jgi:serine/threonine protein kinase
MYSNGTIDTCIHTRIQTYPHTTYICTCIHTYIHTCTGIAKYEDMFLAERMDQGRNKLIVCIVMELCERGDLATCMTDYRKRKEHMSESKAVRWLHQMSSALEYVHSLKMLHRDLKPLNVFITAKDATKIGDFGLARYLLDDCSRV